MDVDIVRTIILIVSFAAFVGIVAWAWSGRQKSRFEEAARLPFEDEAMQRRTLAAQAEDERFDDRQESERNG